MIKKFGLTHTWNSNSYYQSGQGRPRYNVNEGVLHILQSSRTGASPSDFFVSHPGHSLREVLSQYRDTVNVF